MITKFVNKMFLKKLGMLIILLAMNESVYMSESKIKKATFGNGCFWCTEAIFERVNGILSVKSGYSGGHDLTPTYKEVCSGTTGHAEVIQLEYDESIISFDELLEIFFKTHDPTTLNRQGNDVGTQYRSVVFYHSELQKERTDYWIDKLNKAEIYSDPIVTEVTEFSKFYPAEDYHQDYYANNSSEPYCSFVITPKIKKFEKLFEDNLKK